MMKEIVTPYLQPLKPESTDLKTSGSLEPPIRCLLCDFYGTLFISGSGDVVGSAGCSARQEKMLGTLLSKYRVPFTPQQIQEHLRTQIKNDHRRAKFEGVDFPEVHIEQLWQSILGWSDLKKVQAFAVEYEMIVNPIWPMPGIKALLAHCRCVGILLGIISNAQFFTPLLFEWLLGDDPAALGFDPRLIFFSYIHGVAKPSPSMFQMAENHLKQIQIPADRVAYIGNDVRNDIAAAQTVQFQTILFAGDARSLRLRTDDPICNKVSADLIITDLSELERYLH